jgi:acetyl-CoA C-acetyltransferase
VDVELPKKKGDVILVQEDEEFRKVKFDKIKGLKPAFSASGVTTAANSSTLSDGATALVVAGGSSLSKYN